MLSFLESFYWWLLQPCAKYGEVQPTGFLQLACCLKEKGVTCIRQDTGHPPSPISLNLSPPASSVVGLEFCSLNAVRGQVTGSRLLGISLFIWPEICFTDIVMFFELVGLYKNISVYQPKYYYLFLKQKQVNHMSKCFRSCFFLNWPILNNICVYNLY